MSQERANDFVDQLRNMAQAAPVIDVPGAETIVRAGRSRLARRRSAFAGAFGVVLLAGAGLTTALHPGLEAPTAGVSPVALVQQVGEPIGIQPNLGQLDPGQPDLERPQDRGLAPVATDAPNADGAQTEPAPAVEAGGATRIESLSPLATGLGIAGAASLGAAAGLAARSRRLRPAPALARSRGGA